MNNDSRLCHSKKIFSKRNIGYIKELQANRVQSFVCVGSIITLDLTRMCNYNCPYCIDPNIIKKIMESYTDEVIEDEEWI